MSDVNIKDVAAATAKGIVDNARNLGLTWQLTLATVKNGTVPSSVDAVLDGDTEVISVTSMVGALPAGARIYVIVVPPAGNYAVGLADAASAFGILSAAAFTAGSTTSVTYVDMPGPPAVTVTKRSALSSLIVTVHGTFYVLTAASGADFAVNAGGTDFLVDTCAQVNTAFTAHTKFSGIAELTGLPAGSQTVTLRWKRRSGTGQLTVDANDVVSIKVEEKFLV